MVNWCGEEDVLCHITAIRKSFSGNKLMPQKSVTKSQKKYHLQVESFKKLASTTFLIREKYLQSDPVLSAKNSLNGFIKSVNCFVQHCCQIRARFVSISIDMFKGVTPLTNSVHGHMHCGSTSTKFFSAVSCTNRSLQLNNLVLIC